MASCGGYAVGVMQSLLEFQKAGYLCDTMIVVDDGYLRAHSAILAATSSVFKAALEAGDSSTEHTVVLAGVSSYVAKIVLQFVYTGDVVIPDDCLAPYKVTEIFAALQHLGLQLPLADNRYYSYQIRIEYAAFCLCIFLFNTIYLYCSLHLLIILFVHCA